MFTIIYPHPYNNIGDGPEGPEVAKIADSLKQILLNKILLLVHISEKAKHKGLDKLSLPLRMCKIYSHGKKILILLENGTIIANELIMTGHWSKERTKYTKFSLCFENDDEKDSMYFNSIRNFSKTIVLFNKTDKYIYFSKLGPDILKKNINFEKWVDRFRKMTKKRKGSKPYLICDALLEQSIFCGIGNYLRADIMYDARICPYKSCQEMTDEEYERLRISAHKLIRRSYKSNGFTIQNYQDVDGSFGTYRSLVYNQKTCPRGHVVVKERFSSSKFPNRTVHWVPNIQK